MKKETIIVFLILFQCCFILHSCTTKLVVTKVPTCNIDPSKLFAIIKTESSEIISSGIYPTYKTIDQFVINTKPSLQRIDSLFYKELTKRGLKAILFSNQESVNKADQNTYYIIKYQDYWGWDFKMFMQLLKVGLYDNKGNLISEYVSQGNIAGMHDYPMPTSQVPKLVDMILKK